MDWGCRAEWRSTWHVLGCRRSVREWALRQGWGGRLVRQEQAQGMLVAALGLLDGYYGLGRGKAAWATSYWAGGGAGVAPPNQPRK
jgi:hypothetical protein